MVYCAVGLRGYLAARILMQNGFADVRNLSGGYKTWEAATAKIFQQPLPTQNNENQSSCTARDCGGMVRDLTTIDSETSMTGEAQEEILIDACGLQCPGPIMRLKKACDEIPSGRIIRVLATDQGFARDVRSWAKMT